MNLSSTNFHLQLPHWVLERYFPDFLYAQRFTHFWPTPWHMLLNYISFASTLIAVLACAYEGRWTMKLHSSKSVLVHHQFKAYLLYHGIFYALELLTTNMWELFTSMCYHHMLVS